jgi:LysM repeat protein
MSVLSRMVAPVAVIGVGMATFLIVFVMLQLGPTEQPAPLVEAPPLTVLPSARLGNSLATGIAASHVAVGVPTAGWEQLLGGVRAGDRLNVMASLPGADDGRPVTAVVVSGANVLQAATQQAPLLLGVQPDDAVLLAHLVLGGAPLAYVVWPADGSPPPVVAPLDERDTRARLGLTPRPQATATLAPAAPPVGQRVAETEPTAAPKPTAAPEPTAASESTAVPLPDRYVVQPGDTLQSIADDLGVDVGALWWANRHLANPSYVMAGMELEVPKFRGFLYQVRPGDSWFTLSRRFGLTPEYLRERNELPDDAPLNAGMFIFVPLSP